MSAEESLSLIPVSAQLNWALNWSRDALSDCGGYSKPRRGCVTGTVEQQG